MKRTLLRASFAALLTGPALFATCPAAALTQPDGTQIPKPNGSPQGDLQGILNALGDTVDVVADAADVPETFDPTCNLTFTMVSRGGAAFKNVFGWYNVTGQKPPTSDLHVLIPCTAQPPMAFPLGIKTDPNYMGGKIGFFLITPEGQKDYCASTTNIGYVYYSEKSFNPDNMGTNSYIHLLIYDSKKFSKAFYFAWEDLFGGGDNEFTDFVARVDGITCAEGGTPCDTGKQGVCADGMKQCQNGMLTCVGINQPSMEKCNGLDDDCNGKTDDGDICQAGYVCEKGTCVPKCSSGEFVCPMGTVCDSTGHCVDPKCATVTCPAGKVCMGGNCVAACDGVTCPHGQVCRLGACVDPCAGLTCDSDQVCVAGACKPKCQCAGCQPDETCQMDGSCLATACAMVTCSAGQYCATDGSCKDACDGAVCPGGGDCTMGACQPPAGGGGNGGAGGGLVLGGGGASGHAGSANGGAHAGGVGGANGGTSAGGGGGAKQIIVGDNQTADGSSGGCGCANAGADTSALGAGLLGLLAAGARMVRRRRRS